MNVKSIEKKGNEATIVVEIDKELMEKGVNALLHQFLKGKAPRKKIGRAHV